MRAFAQVTACLQQRHPTQSPALVQHCVDEAIRHYRGAAVQLYLSILVERRAADALRAAVEASTLETYTVEATLIEQPRAPRS